jgi:hypothetical protein
MTSDRTRACILGDARVIPSAEDGCAMHMATTIKRWTLEEVHSLPDDGNKYELLRGDLGAGCSGGPGDRPAEIVSCRGSNTAMNSCEAVRPRGLHMMAMAAWMFGMTTSATGVALCQRAAAPVPAGAFATSVLNAPAELRDLARTYPAFNGKGPITAGRRITLMTPSLTYAVGDSVRVLHVLEVLDTSSSLYPMGPKPIYEEYVDGRNVSSPRPNGGSYDGIFLRGPGVDFNYAMTSYVFRTPGVHTVEWRGGGASFEDLHGLRSNVVSITVGAGRETTLIRPAGSAPSGILTATALRRQSGQKNDVRRTRGRAPHRSASKRRERRRAPAAPRRDAISRMPRRRHQSPNIQRRRSAGMHDVS